MEITLVDYAESAKELLIFAKNTRHLDNTIRFEDILNMSSEQKDREIAYVFGTIGSSWEFSNYLFLLQDVTRAFTHQIVRHRHASFAQQSLRVASANEFRYFVPDSIEEDRYQLAIFDNTMSDIQTGYDLLLKKGAGQQDARGILPTNICTNILFGANLRTISELMETRLCVRAQGEFQEAAMTMRNLLLSVHPWALPAVAGPTCVTKGYCQFQNYNCVLKEKHKRLTPNDEDTADLTEDWGKLIKHRYSPQPDQQELPLLPSKDRI